MTRLAGRLSRRGAVLLLFGLDFLVIGLATALLPSPASTVEGYRVADHLLPLHVWGVIWALAGLCGIITAWWPARRDDWGFYAMGSFGLLWACMSLGSTIVYGSARGWILAIIWGSFALALFIVSGMDRERHE